MGEDGEDGKQVEDWREWEGRWGCNDSHLPPYFTRLPFFSCCESKLAHLSAESRLKLGMMMMTMITMVTVVVVMVVTVVSIVNVFIIIVFNDSCVFQLPRSTLQIP